MLRAKGGQPIELATLASYLGSSVHLQASMKLIDSNHLIGDGFSASGRASQDDIGLNEQYLRTVPNVSGCGL
tara:strand:+ start:301 stop:516 length:216 start_codon:yes stop_codon:yes gene_type:complete